MARYSMDGFDPNTDLNWEFKNGDIVIFNTVQSDLVQYNGTVCTIIRRVTEDEADLFDVGPMYAITVGTNYVDKSKCFRIDAFQDELTLVEAIDEPREGVRYYSQLCGHRYWYYTGMKINMQGYPDWGKVTRYRFRDVCGHTEDYTIETFAERFEER